MKEISQKHGVTPRTVYHDLATPESWQPYTTKDAALVILNSFNQIYWEASFNCLQAKGDSNRIGWTKVMLDANKALAEHFVIPSLLRQLEAFEARADMGVFL